MIIHLNNTIETAGTHNTKFHLNPVPLHPITKRQYLVVECLCRPSRNVHLRIMSLQVLETSKGGESRGKVWVGFIGEMSSMGRDVRCCQVNEMILW